MHLSVVSSNQYWKVQTKMAQGSQIAKKDMKKSSIFTLTKIPRIRWRVENVSKISLCSPGITSPEFYLTPESKCLLYLANHLNGFWVYICYQSDAKIHLQRTIVLLDGNDKKLYEKRDENIFSLERNKIVYLTEGISHGTFKNLTNDMLIIELSISINEDAVKKSNYSLCDTDPERKLREDLKTLLENPVNSDVHLQVGEERIPAHWLILCARSPYFKRMFDSGMQESVKNSVTITDSSLGTVKKLVQFLYTADFIQTEDSQEQFDLYYAADKYEVQDLRDLCACNIMDGVTVNNVCQILELGHRHNDKSLKMEAMDFIRLNSEAVFQTEEWEKFKTSEPLAAEFCSFFCMRKD